MEPDTVEVRNVYTTAPESPYLPCAESPSKSGDPSLKNLQVLGGVCSHEWLSVLFKYNLRFWPLQSVQLASWPKPTQLCH